MPYAYICTWDWVYAFTRTQYRVQPEPHPGGPKAFDLHRNWGVGCAGKPNTTGTAIITYWLMWRI